MSQGVTNLLIFWNCSIHIMVKWSEMLMNKHMRLVQGPCNLKWEIYYKKLHLISILTFLFGESTSEALLDYQTLFGTDSQILRTINPESLFEDLKNKFSWVLNWIGLVKSLNWSKWLIWYFNLSYSKYFHQLGT